MTTTLKVAQTFLAQVCLFAATALAQDLSLNLQDHRSLAEGARRIREKTHWMICVEEPLRASKAASTAGQPRDNRGAEPPARDKLQVTFASLRKRGDRPQALQQIVSAYNAQNPGGDGPYRLESVASYQVLVPATGSILSARIGVPRAARLAQDHLNALATAVSSQAGGTEVMVDTAAFGFRFNQAFHGNTDLAVKPFEWGVSNEVARNALAGLLNSSLTSTVWQVDCHVGIKPSVGHCILSVMPITVEVTNSAGRMVKRTLFYDKAVGNTNVVVPPPPPAQ